MNIKDVLHHFGGKKVRLAEALGITKQAVNGWRNGEIPETQVLKLKYEILPKLKGKSEAA